jgi:hypothetical protein
MIDITEYSVLDLITISKIQKDIENNKITLTLVFEMQNISPDIIDYIAYPLVKHVEDMAVVNTWTDDEYKQLVADEFNFPLNRIVINNINRAETNN